VSDGSTKSTVDEIATYLDMRYISAPEAVWRIFEFKMHEQSHTICRLAVHLKDEQIVYFDEGQEDKALEKAMKRETTLTAWFKLNQLDSSAHRFFYRDIPNHYTFNSKTWKLRKYGECTNTIGRMYNVSPTEGERYYLRLLLLHVKGATSYDDIKTFENIPQKTFKEACLARGLLKDDIEWERCLSEAAETKMPKQLRNLFCTICCFCSPSDAPALFEKFKEYLIEDYIHLKDSNETATNKCLIHFEEFFQQQRLSCTTVLGHKYKPNFEITHLNNQTIDVLEEKKLGIELKSKLNTEQNIAVTTILKAVENVKIEKKAFFIDGPGGKLLFYI